MTALLEAQGVSKSFGGVRAVREISLAIPEKSIFALIGPNGAGKSTLLNLLSGIYQPDAGTLQLRRRRPRRAAGAPPRAARHRAHVPEDPALQAAHGARERARRLPHPPRDPGLAVRDARRCRAAATGRVAAPRPRSCSTFVGLGRALGERAGALPYGQQRMLEIARSLATRPRLFMLDEPAAGLNGAEVEFLLQRLEDIGRRGITVVVVEHNMDLVMNVAAARVRDGLRRAPLRGHAARGAGQPAR